MMQNKKLVIYLIEQHSSSPEKDFSKKRSAHYNEYQVMKAALQNGLLSSDEVLTAQSRIVLSSDEVLTAQYRIVL